MHFSIYGKNDKISENLARYINLKIILDPIKIHQNDYEENLRMINNAAKYFDILATSSIQIF